MSQVAEQAKLFLSQLTYVSHSARHAKEKPEQITEVETFRQLLLLLLLLRSIRRSLHVFVRTRTHVDEPRRAARDRFVPLSNAPVK